MRLELLGFRVKATFQWFSRNVFYSSSTYLFACPYILQFVLGARGHLSFIQGLAKYSLVMLIGLFKADKSGDKFWLGGQVGDKLETSLETIFYFKCKTCLKLVPNLSQAVSNTCLKLVFNLSLENAQGWGYNRGRQTCCLGSLRL